MPKYLKRPLDGINHDQEYVEMWRTGHSDCKVGPPVVRLHIAWKNPGQHHCRLMSAMNTAKAKRLNDVSD